MNTKNSSTLTKKYRQTLSAVHMVYRLINSTYNVKELSLRLTRLLCQFIKADSSAIYILDPQKRRLGLIAIYDNKINIWINKKKDLLKAPEKEKRVTQGDAIFEKHLVGLPLVADENVGAILVRRDKHQPPFHESDREMLTVFAEQSVIAIKNLQLNEAQQNVILGSMKFIGKLLQRHRYAASRGHTSVYFKIVKTLAEKLKVAQEEIDNLYYASVLRTTGAIDVPYDILAKSSQLAPEEFKIIREQPAKSVELIRSMEFLKPVLPIILYHHERYDGSGYPSGLKKEQIPLGARIMAVVDAFEAMTSERPYKQRLSIKGALMELEYNSGTQFDPKIVRAFIECSKQKKFKNYLRSTEQ